MHVEMDISGSRLNYVAGDHLAIFPSNDPELVEKIGELLDVDLNTVFSLTNIDGMSVLATLLSVSTCLPACLSVCLSVCLYILVHISLPSLSTETASKKHPFPCPTSYRTALLFYVDITSPPRTNVLRELAEFASDPNDRDFLLRITSPTEEGKVSVSVQLTLPLTQHVSSVSQHEYREWILEDRRTLVAVLEDLPSFKPPLDHLVELLPRLQARYYSISSSSKVSGTTIHWICHSGSNVTSDRCILRQFTSRLFWWSIPLVPTEPIGAWLPRGLREHNRKCWQVSPSEGRWFVQL